MQRVLVIVAAIVLVVASLGVGALAANWPFWRRAWAWHAADGAWPAQLPGPRMQVRGGDVPPLQFESPADELAAVAGGADTQVLLRVRDGVADGWFAPGFDARSIVDGRGLSVLVLEPLFAALEAQESGLRHGPVGAWLTEWRQDARGALTPDALLDLVAAGIDRPPAPTPLNPFSGRAHLASGPGFRSAALAAFAPTDRGDRRAAAAQLLVEVAAESREVAFADLLRQFWPGVAGHDASLLLDRRRGTPAVHCCIEAAAVDWLRLGLLQSRSEEPAAAWRVLRSDGRVLVAAPGSALLWVGEGAAPSGLEMLLQPPPSADEDRPPPL